MKYRWISLEKRIYFVSTKIHSSDPFVINVEREKERERESISRKVSPYRGSSGAAVSLTIVLSRYVILRRARTWHVSCKIPRGAKRRARRMRGSVRGQVFDTEKDNAGSLSRFICATTRSIRSTRTRIPIDAARRGATRPTGNAKTAGARAPHRIPRERRVASAKIARFPASTSNHDDDERISCWIVSSFSL